MPSKFENRSASGGSKVLDADWEVLPPEEKRKRQGLEPIFKWIAFIMDDVMRVPGTRFRFGLDPLIGLIPGVGDTASAVISTFSLIYAARCGIPRIILVRMGLNILINEAVGIIPGVGDAFSFWFKSNVRNRRLLNEHLNSPRAPRRSDWLLVGAILAVVLLVILGGMIVTVLLLRALIRILH